MHILLKGFSFSVMDGNDNFWGKFEMEKFMSKQNLNAGLFLKRRDGNFKINDNT